MINPTTTPKLLAAVENVPQGETVASDNIFGNSGIQPPTGSAPYLVSGNGDTANQIALSNLERLISQAIGILTVVAGLLFIFYFILGAFNWVSAGGDSGKIEKARNTMVQGVIGLIVVVSAYAIMGIVGTITGIDILNPANQIRSIVEFGS